LAALDGSCRTPIAGLARAQNRTLIFRGEVLSLDGTRSWSALREMTLSDTIDAESLRRAEEMGADAAKDVRDAAGEYLPKF